MKNLKSVWRQPFYDLSKLGVFRGFGGVLPPCEPRGGGWRVNSCSFLMLGDRPIILSIKKIGSNFLGPNGVDFMRYPLLKKKIFYIGIATTSTFRKYRVVHVFPTALQ